MVSQLSNRISKIEANRDLCSQRMIIVVNFGSDCEEDWAKAEADSIADYKENNGYVDEIGARFIRLCFI